MSPLLVGQLFLCMASLVFPFSVAATNVTLGIVLAIGLVSGLWWKGAKQCWQCSRNLAFTFCAYIALMVFGLIWSLDMTWGMHVLGHQWFWLLVPIVVVLLKDESWRTYFLVSLSIGLILHLVFCVLQMFEYVTVIVAGSNAQDATGHIGHIGFGVVYGIWASWLLSMGWRWHGRWRWLALLLATWAYLMIFFAQGRGGYIVALSLLVIVILEVFRGRHLWRPIALILSVTLVVSLVFVLGPAKERWQHVWNSLSQLESGADSDTLTSTEQRVQMFRTSFDIWRAHPLLGVGTGGVPRAVAQLGPFEGGGARIQFVHPHNQYIFNLVRWGPSGLLLLLAVFYCWLCEGWKYRWDISISYQLIALTGAGLMIYGLFSPVLEEHFSGVLAALLLGAGLSDLDSES